MSCTVACGEAPADQELESVQRPADGAFADSAMWQEIAARCGAPADDEAVLFSNEFSWGYTQEGMAARFDEVYGSGMRLQDRAFFDAETGQYMLKTSDAWGSWVVLPERLVENVTLHIEGGLARGIVDHVFFPDMGHSHFFVPEERWESEYAGGPVSAIAERNTRMFADPSLKVLYHTAEQLQMLDDDDQVLDDPWVQNRFETRNLVGDNDGQRSIELLTEPESKANTARDLAGYHYFGAGFNISASEEGCFPYVKDGEVLWYDLSLSDLPYDTSGGGGDDYF